eukprot:jgi/Psemu1/316923/fgenesh1_kg.4669_\
MIVLYGNTLTGTFPSEIGLMTSLTYLDLCECRSCDVCLMCESLEGCHSSVCVIDLLMLMSDLNDFVLCFC